MTLTAHWIQHLNNWQNSGMTQAAYCREHQLNVKTFAARLHDFRNQESASAFIPVQVQEPPPATALLVLHTGHGLRLGLPITVSAPWLAESLRCWF
ncbi:MAG: IS66 family insertion sequence element accessory protein TnpB [Methylococcaceae bacterium]